MILGNGGVELISCDLGYINGVDSSLHFFFFFLEFCVDFGDFFFFFSIEWWWWVVPMGGGGGLCLGMVVAGCAVYGGGFVTGCVCVWSGFLFCIFYIDGFF